MPRSRNKASLIKIFRTLTGNEFLRLEANFTKRKDGIVFDATKDNFCSVAILEKNNRKAEDKILCFSVILI